MMDSTAGFWNTVVTVLAAWLLFVCFCGEEQEDLNVAVFLYNLEGIKLFFSGSANLY